MEKFSGKIWVLGDDIDTDIIIPTEYLALKTVNDMAPYAFSPLRPELASQIQKGDIIVAGKNFGCGSSRPGSKILKTLGIGAVIAESVSRIFFRNSINLGFPIITCPGIHDAFEEGEELEVDLYEGTIRSLTTQKCLAGDPLPEGSPPMEILKAGGLLPMLERQIGKL